MKPLIERLSPGSVLQIQKDSSVVEVDVDTSHKSQIPIIRLVEYDDPSITEKVTDWDKYEAAIGICADGKKGVTCFLNNGAKFKTCAVVKITKISDRSVTGVILKGKLA